MRIALIVLAVGSVVVGFLGVPAVLGGHDMFGTWLHSVWTTPPEPHGDPHAIEYILMGVSVALALLGIALAWWIYRVREGRPAETFAKRNRRLHALVHDKYRVDEAYDAVVVQPLLAFNETVGKCDNQVIDGAVNGTAESGAQASHATGYFDNEVVDGALNAGAKGTLSLGRRVRRLQTGNIRHYIAFALVGGLFVIALFSLLAGRDGGPIQEFLERLFGGTP
jgi:NADH-quinone oxidoreductase subunit L